MAKKLYGTDPDQVPTNADLGTMAYQNKDSVTVDTLGVGTRQQDAEGLRLLVAHDGHGVGIDYVGALPAQAGIFTSGTAHTQTAYGDLNIKARTDYGGYYGIGFFTASSNNTPVRRAYFNSTGNLVFQSGKGIVFADAGGSGTPTSNTLDEYEEGTWTPTWGGDTSNGSVTYTSQQGNYVRVGSIVTVRGRLTTSAISSSPTGNLRIRGLPFTNLTGNEAVGSVGYGTCFTTGKYPDTMHVGTAQTGFYLYYASTKGNNLSSVNQGTDLTVGTFYFACTYIAS